METTIVYWGYNGVNIAALLGVAGHAGEAPANSERSFWPLRGGALELSR